MEREGGRERERVGSSDEWNDGGEWGFRGSDAGSGPKMRLSDYNVITSESVWVIGLIDLHLRFRVSVSAVLS